ncbi:fasciclin domain-containing protein [Mucilaginibacter mali]|uniref:Fasciclin domain-containing protein n=1 Tax=Mucilaginibacter mali TaxID=2740462 RepID=A0A7D4ULF1_9SPHI|nr:fasciclin domain-containing protein [Mucilaginibacter mali]QKJ29761.1 fasciclin domain-containing protein [Mucilaginibacter mali]
MNRIKIVMLLIVSGIALMVSLNGCKQNHLTLTTTSTVNMYSYLQQNPNSFSLFQQIVDKAGYASFLNTYGTYTLFAPTNDGVNAYLKKTGKASVDAIDAATAKSLVSIALIADTLSTQFFTDGKLRTPTTIGQYLITGNTTVNGVSSTVINKQANLVKGNIKVGNGIIHSIDNVLIPANLTIAQTIEQNPKYSIFTAALKATGFYDTLNVSAAANTNVNRKYLTLIAIPDSVYKAAKFADFNALKTRYSTKGDPKNHADSLWLYMGYHIWSELSYISDIAVLPSHATLAPLEITTSTLIGQDVLLNNDTFNGVLEPGVKLYRPTSDMSATNGVIHNALDNYTIKIRFPSPVYFDVCVQPEILKTPGLYRGSSKNQQFNPGTIAGIVATGSSNYYVNYISGVLPIPATSTDYYYNNDYMNIGVRWRTGNNGANTIEYVTPVIVKGTYKIWIDYKRQGSGQVTPTFFDGVSLPNTFNNVDPLNGNETDAQAESRGFKSYSDSPVTTNLTSAYNGHVGRLLGIVTIKTTDHHKFKMVATAGTGDARVMLLDVIEFRPVDMDQVHPRLGRDGSLVP